MSIECQVHWARPGDARPEFLRWFTAAERERAAAYRREVDRDRFIVGCALSRLALGALLSLPPGAVPLVRDCADCGRPHGRPRVLVDDTEPERPPGEPGFVSVSHSGEHVVVAVSRSGPVGVDVEQHRPEALDVADTVLTAAERTALAALPDERRLAGFFGHWTRKEAVLKATGHGLRVPMDAIDVTGAAPRTVPGRADDMAGLSAEVARLRLVALAVDGEHSAALALGARPHLVHVDGGALLRDAM